jgi:hypothetical protein
MKSFQEKLNESNLSRVLKHMEAHDTGAITAYRGARDCGKGKEYTKKENKARQKNLLAKLQTMGYGVTKTTGKSKEGDKTVKEGSFFVVDIKDGGNLKKDLLKLGKMFEQDSVLIIPKGGKEGILIGSNNCDGNFLKFGQEMSVGKRFLGKSGTFYSTVNGKPFLFGEECYVPQNIGGKHIRAIMASKTWEEQMDYLE